MGDSLSRFVENINSGYGVAFNNRFEVSFGFPNGAAGDGVDTNLLDTLLPLYCTTMSIPPRNIMSSPVRLEHAQYEMPYGISYEPVTFTFYMDREHKIRRFFKTWYDTVYNNNTNGLAFQSSYAVNIDLKVFDRKDNETFGVVLKNAWPKSIGDLQYNTAGQGEVLTMQVQFVYERMLEADKVDDQTVNE